MNSSFCAGSFEKRSKIPHAWAGSSAQCLCASLPSCSPNWPDRFLGQDWQHGWWYYYRNNCPLFCMSKMVRYNKPITCKIYHCSPSPQRKKPTNIWVSFIVFLYCRKVFSICWPTRTKCYLSVATFVWWTKPKVFIIQGKLFKKKMQN